MFGYVMAARDELTKEQQQRYTSVYCGICRQIRLRASGTARLGLRFDMAFLALLHMSLYEPEETCGTRACGFHPIKPRPWVDNEFVQYAADMNVALAYYKALDDQADEKRLSARMLAKLFGKHCPHIARQYPRQCGAMAESISRLSQLEKENCSNPDLLANCFGSLMAELLVYRQDMWETALRRMGMALGRFIYLADAAVDYRQDRKKHRYNPFLAMGMEEDWSRWEEYLTLDMACCTDSFERLPLVQDADILRNILYAGVWTRYAAWEKKGEKK